MRYSNFPRATILDAWCSSANPTSIVGDELEWRALPQRPVMASSSPRVIATRWQALKAQPQEFDADTADDCHVVKIVLRSMNIRLSTAGITVHDGVVTPGMFHVTQPAVPARCLFRGPYDTLHLHVPNDLIAECASDMHGRQDAVLCSEGNLAKDPWVERLARALLDNDQRSGSFGQMYADGISIAIVARLLVWPRRVAPAGRATVNVLPRWQLNRAIEYIETRLSEPVSLGDVASATGLSRMHFAAQFKAATGLRPHEYLLRRRVERAQEMLVGTAMSVADAAQSVGFQNQSHFTSVFKRFAGEPPRTWLRSHGDGAALARLEG
jgi:AraC family transcriptional regulator